MSSEVHDVFETLIPYLSHSRLDVRNEGIRVTLSQMGDPAFMKWASGGVGSKSEAEERVTRLVKGLRLSLVPNGGDATVDALQLLVTLTGNNLVNRVSTALKVHVTAIEILKDGPDCIRAGASSEEQLDRRAGVLILKLLLNLTRTEDGSADVVGRDYLQTLKGHFLGLMVTKLNQMVKHESENVESKTCRCQNNSNDDILALFWGVLANVSYFDSCRAALEINVITSRSLIALVEATLRNCLTSINGAMSLELGRFLRHVFWDREMIERNKAADGLISSALTFIVTHTYPSGAALASAKELDDSTNQSGTPRSYPERVEAMGATMRNVEELRQTALDVMTGVLSTETGREAARKMDLYPCVRLWDLAEESDVIKEGIAEQVHLMVYSEQELKQQDENILANDL